jgi:hypothetical protein
MASSSVVERSAVNRLVVGSNPTLPATLTFFFCSDGVMAAATDLKSVGLTTVRVRVPLRVPLSYVSIAQLDRATLF